MVGFVPLDAQTFAVAGRYSRGGGVTSEEEGTGAARGRDLVELVTVDDDHNLMN